MQMENEKNMLIKAQDFAYSVGNNYIATQVQISGVLVGFLSIGLFGQATAEGGVSLSSLESVLLFIAFGALLLSLVLGLVGISQKKEFFLEQARAFQQNFAGWSAYLKGETTFEHATKTRANKMEGKTEWASKAFFFDAQTGALVVGVISICIFAFSILFI